MLYIMVPLWIVESGSDQSVLWRVGGFPLILHSIFLLRDLFSACIGSVLHIPRSSPTLKSNAKVLQRGTVGDFKG
jgi:hypothetical protein